MEAFFCAVKSPQLYMQDKQLKKFEAELWSAADQLRANSNKLLQNTL